MIIISGIIQFALFAATLFLAAELDSNFLYFTSGWCLAFCANMILLYTSFGYWEEDKKDGK